MRHHPGRDRPNASFALKCFHQKELITRMSIQSIWMKYPNNGSSVTSVCYTFRALKFYINTITIHTKRINFKLSPERNNLSAISALQCLTLKRHITLTLTTLTRLKLPSTGTSVTSVLHTFRAFKFDINTFTIHTKTPPEQAHYSLMNQFHRRCLPPIALLWTEVLRVFPIETTMPHLDRMARLGAISALQCLAPNLRIIFTSTNSI
jgi:hypothetical protein